MKILWFIPIPPKAALEKLGASATGTGFWIHSLIDELSGRDGIELAVAYVQRGATEPFIHDGVKYYSISDYLRNRYSNLVSPLKKYFDKQVLYKASQIIADFQPDLIHVHGTESIFSLLKAFGYTSVPTVISIQGIIMEYSKYSWGHKSFWDIVCIQGLRELAGGFALLRQPSSYKKRGVDEQISLKAVDGIIGRTSWDRAYSRGVALNVPYYHVDELMRPEFFGAQWQLRKCQKYRIYTSGRLTFLKGMHTFIEAMALLKGDYPQLDIRIAGGNVPTCEFRFLINMVRTFGLSDTVRFIGWIPGEKIVEELQRTHLYVNASFIENSPNALQEAMLMGVPCIASFAGGMPSILKHRAEGAMFSPGDPFSLAETVRELFENDDLAVTLGKAARNRALMRNDPDRIVTGLISAYRDVTKNNSSQFKFVGKTFHDNQTHR